MTSSPTANWSAMRYVFSSIGSSHHIGRHIGARSKHASPVSRIMTSTIRSRTLSDCLMSSATSAPASQGAMENCIAGISALACAHRTKSSRSGRLPKYALPPIMSGRQNGYPITPEVSRVGMIDRKPLPLPHSLNRSPMRVSTPTPVVPWPVRTSANANWLATRSTQYRVYSLGCPRASCVSNMRGRKHGSPASNLNPSMPYLCCRLFKRVTNQFTASGFVTSSATTGGVFHHLKKPGFKLPCRRLLVTKYPFSDPSRYASVSSSTKGITQSVTANPSACSSSTISFGSGNLFMSKSSSPYPACHLSSISITDAGRSWCKISRANVRVFFWSTFCLYLAHVVQMGARITSGGGGAAGRGSVARHVSVAARTSGSAQSATRMLKHRLLTSECFIFVRSRLLSTCGSMNESSSNDPEKSYVSKASSYESKLLSHPIIGWSIWNAPLPFANRDRACNRKDPSPSLPLPSGS
mmetsp:Transcript_14206/g.59850  ORF Transcript_14206/g.59850 Transcript_14206/m.59850 type:complete len:468 (-) Transcript_14206:1828-3231(-)